MKKCPICDKTFEDSMRFCQVDGTPLVDEEPAFDPYATIVAGSAAPIEGPAADEAAAAPTPDPEPESAEETEPEFVRVAEEPIEPVAFESPSLTAIEVPEDVLDLPEADPLRTMYVSDSEMQAALGEADEPAASDIVEIPPADETPAPELPTFNVPDVPAPSFGDISPPPSPFSESENIDDRPTAAPPMFDEQETVIQQAASAYDPPPPAPVAEWTPPPAPDTGWQNQEIGANTPFQPPPAGTGGENKTLAIVSLVTGILSIFCCGWFVPGIAAIIMGFIAKGKATSDPAQYGGAGLALGGMITGAVSIVLGIIVVILYVLGYAATLMR